MKSTLVIAAALLMVFACKSKQKTADTTKETANTTTTTNTAPAATLSMELASAAMKRYPDVPAANIADGEKLYKGKCGKCHGLPDVDSRTEEKWPKTIDWMAPKANLTDAEKQKVLQYVLCARDVKLGQ